MEGDDYTGLRSGELSTLKWDDVSGDTILVTRTQTRHKENGGAVFSVRESTKGREGRRRIAIPPEAHVILGRIRAKNIQGEYIFMSDVTGNRMKADSFSKKLVRICRYIHIPVRRLHKIRKTYDSILLDAGVDDSIVTSQMGHTNLTTTIDFYYRDRHTYEEKVRAISSVLSGSKHD
ncbi:MAG: tyrosine-type recombinase/integrase [Eubacterium sp.]|nr:tyrosine-type recombinase/integrase [Eubacterium sp.]